MGLRFKKLHFLLLSLFASGIALAAPPDCSYSFRFTNVSGEPTDGKVTYKISSGAATTVALNNITNACTAWSFQYDAQGLSALSIQLDSAPNVSAAGTPGTFVTFAGTTVAGSNPSSVTTSATYTATGYYPFISVVLNSSTGTGSINITLNGWKSPAYISSVGGGSGGNATAYTSVSYSATPTFTCSAQIQTFYIQLTGNVTSSTTSGCSTPGQIIQMVVAQDSTGGRTFVPPTTWTGYGGVDPTLNSYTAQSLYVETGGTAVPFSLSYVSGINGGSIALPGSSSGTTYIVPASVAGGTLTVPTVSTTDTLATLGLSQTFAGTQTFDNIVINGTCVGSGCGGGGGGSPVWAKATITSTAVNLPQSTNTFITFDTVDSNSTSGMFTVGDSKIYAPANGIYSGVCALITASSQTSGWTTQIFLNGTSFTTQGVYSAYWDPALTFTLYMHSGDYVQCMAAQYNISDGSAEAGGNSTFALWAIH